MRSYEDRVRRELTEWERKLIGPPGFLERTSKAVQNKINRVIPAKIHAALTAAVKTIVRTVLLGLEFVPKTPPQTGLTLQQRDEKAADVLSRYKKIAAAEGAGTGAGGWVLGLADFPALIAIKMKFLFELAHVYGYSTGDYRERLFLLHVFQLAFSSRERKSAVFQTVKQWDETVQRWPAHESYLQTIDWEQFQQEYRDAIDFRKMLQLVPGIGAVVGAWANYGLMEELGAAGINCYRLRILRSGGQNIHNASE